MKTILIVLAAAFLSADVFLHMPSEYANNYCAEMKDGMLVITHEGDKVNTEVTLENGTIIKPNGEVIRKAGTKFVLSVGECIDHEGNLLTTNPDKNFKEEPK